MKINRLLLENFRNYGNLDLNFHKKVNILFGKNAQGKTSILEALYYLSLLTSYRTNYDADLLKHGNEHFYIAGEYTDAFNAKRIKVSKVQNNKKRMCSINDVSITTKEYIGEIKVVSFSPDDLDIIKGEPAIRRKFINIQLSRINKYYYGLLVKFNAILKQRNKLLKDIKEGKCYVGLLNAWDCEYAAVVLEICKQRKLFFEEFLPYVLDFFHLHINVVQENLRCEYKTNVEIQEELSNEQNIENILELLKKNHEQDIRKGNTGIGPHKDDFIFTINGHEANKFASQGQQRSIVLALKIAEIKYILKKTEEYPVLLLDDVLSELDENKKNNFLAGLDENLQVFITVTELELLPKSFLKDPEQIDFFKIEQGKAEYYHG